MSKIISETYIVDNKKVNKRIVVLSDIHYWSKKHAKKLDEIIDYLKTIEYDFICIPGDLINDGKPSDTEILVNFIEKISVDTKVIISLGNHDTMILKNKRKYYKNEELFNKISEIKNVYLLDNDYCEINHVRFIGVTLPNDYYNYNENDNYFYRYINNIYDELPKNCYNVVLCHSPASIREEIINNIPFFKNVNLVISGHLHAGLIPSKLRKSFKGRGIISPHKCFFPKRCYGKHKVGNFDLVISPGITKFSDNTIFKYVNFMFKKEIVIIDLKK